MFFTYILLLSNNKYYIGQTNDVHKRFYRHQTGQVKSTKGFQPLKLVYYERFETRGESMRREKQLKAWKSHERITELINSPDGLIV